MNSTPLSSFAAALISWPAVAGVNSGSGFNFGFGSSFGSGSGSGCSFGFGSRFGLAANFSRFLVGAAWGCSCCSCAPPLVVACAAP
ncbi:hypothetical protein EV401DRAFT_2002117 [Pisolithus croceorrhizus]|nr:hypothetical protein EV401DRAFT_2002117 [Pisolithus croceorrhizus]